MARRPPPTQSPTIDYLSRADSALASVEADLESSGDIEELDLRLDTLINKGRGVHKRLPLQSPPRWYENETDALDAFSDRMRIRNSARRYGAATRRLVALLSDEDHWRVSGIETATPEANDLGDLLRHVLELIDTNTWSLTAVATALWQYGKPSGPKHPLPEIAGVLAPFARTVDSLWRHEPANAQRLVEYADALARIARSMEVYVAAIKEGLRAATEWNPAWLGPYSQFLQRYNAWLVGLERHFTAVLVGRAPTFARLEDAQTVRSGSTSSLRGGTFGPGEKFIATEAIRQIIASAKTEVLIVDNYTSAETLSLLYPCQALVVARVLTDTISPDYLTMATRFRGERGATSLETRKTKDNHDRYIILDDAVCYHVGATIKDLGKKTFSYSLKDDAAEVAKIKAVLAASWASGVVVP
ncbi:MAG TPA: hypothetical protein VHE35_03380 [Kofleriaceae bacterium]|nr:hypothetical protein [Kofleriaceae bacterium]